METILHVYHPKRTLVLLEYANKTPGRSENISNEPCAPPNVLLFVGGLYDNLRWPRYVDDLGALFPRDLPGQKWRVMQVQLSTNQRSWGLFDLDRDVEEIAAAISYIRSDITRSQSTPVVLMGFSTGCQDLMHYLVSPVNSPSSPRPSVSGIILQAPVSDRQAMLHAASESPSIQAAYDKALSIASSTPPDRQKLTFIPMDVTTPFLGPAPVTVARFLSLASPGSPENPMTEDYYSSDLFDQRLHDTFGRIGSITHLLPPNRNGKKSIMILQGAVDGAIPPSVDKAQLMARWKAVIEHSGEATLSQHSTIIEHAKHDIAGSSLGARTARLVDMRRAVLNYLGDVVGGIGHGPGQPDGNTPWEIWNRDMIALKKEGEEVKDTDTKSADESKL